MVIVSAKEGVSSVLSGGTAAVSVGNKKGRSEEGAGSIACWLVEGVSVAKTFDGIVSSPTSAAAISSASSTKDEEERGKADGSSSLPLLTHRH